MFCSALISASLNVEEVVMVHTLCLLLVVTPYMLYTVHRCGQGGYHRSGSKLDTGEHTVAKVRIFSS